MSIEIRNVSKQFGDFQALRDQRIGREQAADAAADHDDFRL